MKTVNIHKTNVARRMAASMGLPLLTITQNRHAMASRQRAAKATGDTGLGNSIATQEKYYDDHQEAQGIVSKNLANAAILAKLALEKPSGDAENDAFYAEKAVKDNELAKEGVKKKLDKQLFQKDICRVETRNARSKITSQERKLLCLAAYSMLDVEYSAWVFNSPEYPKSVLSWKRHFEKLMYGPVGEPIRDIVFNVCTALKLPGNKDMVKEFLYLVKESFISWNRILLDRNKHTILGFTYLANRKEKVTEQRPAAITDADTQSPQASKSLSDSQQLVPVEEPDDILEITFENLPKRASRRKLFDTPDNRTPKRQKQNVDEDLEMVEVEEIDENEEDIRGGKQVDPLQIRRTKRLLWQRQTVEKATEAEEDDDKEEDNEEDSREDISGGSDDTTIDANYIPRHYSSSASVSNSSDS